MVLTVCRDMNFSTVQMRMHGAIFEEVLSQDEDEDPSWNIALTLGNFGSLRVARTTAADAPNFMMKALVHLQKQIEQKDFSERKHSVEPSLKSSSLTGAA